MPRRRTIADQDRDAQAVELRRRHLNYRQIAAQMGYQDASGAHRAVERGLADARQEASEAVKQLELDRLDDIARGFQRVFATRHYVVSTATGKVARHPETGELLVDDAPVINAGLALVRVMERRSKYLGLDAPARARIEVITEDVVDAECRRLAAEIAERESSLADAGHPGTA